MKLKKDSGGFEIMHEGVTYAWEHDGDVTEVPYEFGLILLGIKGGGFHNMDEEAVPADGEAPAGAIADRQASVAAMDAEGASRQEIADAHGVSTSTVARDLAAADAPADRVPVPEPASEGEAGPPAAAGEGEAGTGSGPASGAAPETPAQAAGEPVPEVPPAVVPAPVTG